MPIYEYVCRDCGHGFECLVRNNEKPRCPSCGQSQLTKQLSLPVAHTGGGADLSCAAREDGSCDVPQCPGKSCGLGGPF